MMILRVCDENVGGCGAVFESSPAASGNGIEPEIVLSVCPDCEEKYLADQETQERVEGEQ